MSRIGKLPIAIPSGVTVTVKGNEVVVKGPKGELAQSINPDIQVEAVDGQVIVNRPTDYNEHRALRVFSRVFINTMLAAVSQGHI